MCYYQAALLLYQSFQSQIFLAELVTCRAPGDSSFATPVPCRHAKPDSQLLLVGRASSTSAGTHKSRQARPAPHRFHATFYLSTGWEWQSVIRMSGINDFLFLSDTLCLAAALWTDCRTPFVTMVADGHCNERTCSWSVLAIKSFSFRNLMCVRVCACFMPLWCVSQPSHVWAKSIICCSVSVFETCLTALRFVGYVAFLFYLFL